MLIVKPSHDTPTTVEPTKGVPGPRLASRLVRIVSQAVCEQLVEPDILFTKPNYFIPIHAVVFLIHQLFSESSRVRI
jgi:hypothetical protein